MSKGFFFLLVIAFVMVASASGSIIKTVSKLNKTYYQHVESACEQ